MSAGDERPSEWDWPHGPVPLAVWAAVGAGQDPGPPEVAVARYAGWDRDVLLASLAPQLVAQPDAVIVAAAWAGLARVATARRDAAIRAALGAGLSTRQVAAQVGLSGPGVIKVRDRG